MIKMVVFPSALTEEEEALQKKYAKLKKKVRDYALKYDFELTLACVQTHTTTSRFDFCYI